MHLVAGHVDFRHAEVAERVVEGAASGPAAGADDRRYISSEQVRRPQPHHL